VSAILALTTSLKDLDPEVRANSAGALGKLIACNAKDAIPRFTAALHDSDPIIRLRAAQAFGSTDATTYRNWRAIPVFSVTALIFSAAEPKPRAEGEIAQDSDEAEVPDICPILGLMESRCFSRGKVGDDG
jgi:hypothetical protein